MGIGRPGGPYADRLLSPGAWPDVDEDSLYDCATACTRALQELTFRSAEPWARERNQTFDGGVWIGSAAGAASGKAGTYAVAFSQLQNYLVAAATWNSHAAGMVVNAKTLITNNVREAQELIAEIEASNEPNDTADSRKQAIDNVVNTYHALNLGVIASTSAQVPSTNTWKPPANAMDQLLRQHLPAAGDQPAPATPTPGQPPIPPTGLSGLRQVPSAAPPRSVETPQNPTLPGQTETTSIGGGRQDTVAEAPKPKPVVNPPAPGDPPPAAPLGGGRQDVSAAPPAPSAPLSPPNSHPTAPTGPAPAGPVAPGPSGQPGLPATPGGPSGTPASPMSSPGGGGTPGSPTSPQTGQSAQGPQTPQAAQVAKPESATGATGPKPTGMQAPVQPPSAPLSNATPATPLTAPAAPIEQAASSPTAPAATHPAVPTGNVAPPSAPAAPPTSPTPPMPLGAPATPPPAAPVAPAAGPPVLPAATNNAQPGGAAAAPIPVSTARAERDLIASSAAAGALKRKMGGNDPLSVARRIAAALNAPDMSRLNDIGFFWLVGLTADDTIVVANSYGIAYIPDGVNLPEQVKMASADTSIPPTERARWATYPVAALTAWAQAHEKTLRAVIGAKTHLEGIDPGAHKVLLEDDDIPPSGKMTGRTRLEILSPDAATKLAAVRDADLIAQLPPAQADNTPPANETFTLWFDVMKPLMSIASGREIAHLNAFVLYAAHSADLALYRAHSATETADQRAAIADWLYWLHQYDLLTEAQADVTAKA